MEDRPSRRSNLRSVNRSLFIFAKSGHMSMSIDIRAYKNILRTFLFLFALIDRDERALWDVGQTTRHNSFVLRTSRSEIKSRTAAYLFLVEHGYRGRDRNNHRWRKERFRVFWRLARIQTRTFLRTDEQNVMDTYGYTCGQGKVPTTSARSCSPSWQQ